MFLKNSNRVLAILLLGCVIAAVYSYKSKHPLQRPDPGGQTTPVNNPEPPMEVPEPEQIVKPVAPDLPSEGGPIVEPVPAPPDAAAGEPPPNEDAPESIEQGDLPKSPVPPRQPASGAAAHWNPGGGIWRNPGTPNIQRNSPKRSGGAYADRTRQGKYRNY